MNFLLSEILYLLMGYLVGSAGLYLFLTSFRRDLHTKGSGNTTVLHGLQQGHLIPAVSNLIVETLKPILLVLAGINWLGIESPLILLFGVCAAVGGRMFPVYLRFRHGGKGTMTAVFGVLTVYPVLLPLILINLVLQALLLNLFRQHYRSFITTFYLAFPLLGAWSVNNWHTLFPLTLWSLMSIGFGKLRPEDMDIGYQRLRDQVEV